MLTETTGYRHDSIPAGVRAIQRLGRTHRFSVDTTGTSSGFTTKGLARYDAVIFLSATGTPVARRAEQRAFERYIKGGGGYLGIHAASDTRGKWPWYEAWSARASRVTRPGQPGHGARRGPHVGRHEDLPRRGRARTSGTSSTATRAGVYVLATVDESTYTGGTMGADHPIAWCHRYDGGRSVYTAMGHTRQSFTERRFLAHLQGAIEMAAGRARFDCARLVPFR